MRTVVRWLDNPWKKVRQSFLSVHANRMKMWSERRTWPRPITHDFAKVQTLKQRYFIKSQLELELEHIQTHMAQKPVLRADVYARALRASNNLKRSQGHFRGHF
jgi:hypothetical protein